jgi:pimeloyl-ACP methyl ester carboxylesterase
MNSSANFRSDSERISRGMRVMFRAMRPRRDVLTLPGIQQTASGYEFHIYYPRGKAIHTLILVYGMSIAGENDARLVKFARSCANAGLKVIVPHLPGLMEYCFAHNDLQRLIEIARLLLMDTREKLGVIGFSTGGSYSMLLARHPALRERIGPVVLFSPIYDARDVARRLHAPPDPLPQTTKDWDHFYWTQFFIAYRNRKNLKFSQAVQSTLQTLLVDWEEYNLGEKRVFYNKHILPLHLFERTDLLDEGITLEQLSARGKLASVKSPVFLLHDADDRIVPPDHSRRMHAELALRGAEFHQEILVTPWLSHVMLQNTGSLSELTKIVSFTAELFR